MKIGELLKTKFDFTDPRVKLKFTEKYGYTNYWLSGVLNDQFPELNVGQLDNISEFTGLSMEQLLSLQTPKPDHGVGHPLAPPGKPWVSNPIIATINIKPIEDVLNIGKFVEFPDIVDKETYKPIIRQILLNNVKEIKLCIKIVKEIIFTDSFPGVITFDNVTESGVRFSYGGDCYKVQIAGVVFSFSKRQLHTDWYDKMLQRII